MKFGLVILLLLILLPNVSEPTMPGSHTTCKKNELFKAQNTIAWSTPSRVRGFFYKSGWAVDADGAFRAYHPTDRLGLDSLGHAGHRGNWWALVTDNGKTDGRPCRTEEVRSGRGILCVHDRPLRPRQSQCPRSASLCRLGTGSVCCASPENPKSCSTRGLRDCREFSERKDFCGHCG